MPLTPQQFREQFGTWQAPLPGREGELLAVQQALKIVVQGDQVIPVRQGEHAALLLASEVAALRLQVSLTPAPTLLWLRVLPLPPVLRALLGQQHIERIREALPPPIPKYAADVVRFRLRADRPPWFDEATLAAHIATTVLDVPLDLNPVGPDGVPLLPAPAVFPAQPVPLHINFDWTRLPCGAVTLVGAPPGQARVTLWGEDGARVTTLLRDGTVRLGISTAYYEGETPVVTDVGVIFVATVLGA